MRLPRELNMKETAHGVNRNGGGFYMYEDTQGLGVVLLARRNTARDRFVDIWSFKWTPGVECTRYDRLRDAVAACPDEVIAAEKAKWPQIHELPREHEAQGGATCWLHTDRPMTHMAQISTCWLPVCTLFARVCADCAEAAKTDATVVERAAHARQAAVKERRRQLEAADTGKPQ